jgi:membrane protein required for colicin V production
MTDRAARASIAPRACKPTLPVTAFDAAVLVIVLVSTLVGLARGVVRECVALASWVAGIVLAFTFAVPVAAALPWLNGSPVVKHVIAFALVLVGVLVAGALIGTLLSKMLRAVGLGLLDRALGAVFGVARGVAMILLFVLVAGLTTLPHAEWWQNAATAPYFVDGALALRPWLPPAWAERLDYSGAERRPARKGTTAAFVRSGEAQRCAES